MKLDTAFLHSKVARRIFTLFVISDVVPIVTLALFSFNQVNSLLQEQSSLQLHSESKIAGMAIMERLTFLSNELRQLASHLDEKPSSRALPLTGEVRERMASLFDSITFIDQAGRPIPLLGRATAAPRLSVAETSHLSAGKTLLMVVPGRETQSRILMTRLRNPALPDGGLVVAVVNPVRLFDFEATDTGILSVVDASGHLLFSTSPVTGEVPATASRTAADASSGRFKWRRDGNGYLAGYWNLFLKPDFLVPPWTIVVSESESNIQSHSNQFHRIFPPVIALSLFVVILLSVSQIRRQMVPLEQLREAANKAAHRDFRHATVTVTSGDEFEELAAAFNRMTTKLGRQFNILSAMAEIDRNILSALNADYIIETLLRRMHEVIPCDFVFMAAIEKGDPFVARLQISDPRQQIEPPSQEVHLTPGELDELKQGEEITIEPSREVPPGYIAPLRELGAQGFIVFPVILPDGLAGIIGLAYRDIHGLDPEEIAQARELADRTAVALSNAAWGDKLYHHAHYDALTDLPNRILLKDRLEQALVRAARDGSLVGVLFIDLDRFKKVNDSLGHRTGDRLLVNVAGILNNCVRKADTVIRLGGDEFTVIIPDIDRNEDVFSVVSSIARKIITALSLPMMVDNKEISPTASIGVAVYPRDADNFDDLLKNADSAMYHAKRLGGNNFQFYSPQMNAKTLEQLELESGLRRALERGEFELHYQPQVSVVTGHVVGAEALLRWHHPEMGLILPARFIPMAEETGLILPIGEWVLRSACIQAKIWHDQGFPDVKIAVNLSARQFCQPDLLRQVEQALSVGIPPASLEVEITEAIYMDNAESTVERLRQIKELGVSISIDDFGTGYSSLSYLKRFPIDTLKIDYCFIHPLPADAGSATIVRAIIAMAQGLNMTLIAEGVEKVEQYEFLKQLGCQFIQGFYTGKPMPSEEFRLFLEDTRSFMDPVTS
jgi:diguanylate cyclase (GGDEF)-like protein